MKKILVIEDEQDIRLHIVKMLHYEGYHTLDAEDGRIGVQRARQEHPDLIICDVLMPRLNGYGVLTELRRDPVTAAIPFIFLTAKASQDDMRKGMRLGADDYLTKPFKVPDLLDAVKIRLEKQAALSRRLDHAQFALNHALPQQFQTPLNAIIGFAEFLVNFAPDLSLDLEEIIDMQRPILDNALQLKRLIENYLLYTSLKSLGTESEDLHEWECDAPCDTKALIVSVIMENAEQWHRQNDIHLDLIEHALCLPDKNFQKIVEELCDNACRYSERDSPIHITTTLEDGLFCLRVSDRGPGISEGRIALLGADIQALMSPHEQQPSLGVGLSIVRLLSELYGGTLRIESAPETGTCAIVRFEE